MKILFICKHNRFRSKVAEALFSKYNKNKNIRAFSRGISLDEERMYVAPNVKKALRKVGVKRVENTPRRITRADIKLADLIIVVANDVKLSRNLIKGKKVIYWKIKDTSQSDYNGILKRVYIIKGKIKKLLRNLEHK